MSDLIAIAYDEEFKAGEVLQKLERMKKEHLIDLDDAVVVIRDEDGKVKLKQTHNLVVGGAASGSLWGMLIGLLFLNPLLGIAVGAGSGALVGFLTDIGIDDKFMKEIGETLVPGSSALFLLVRKVTPDKVLPEVQPFGGTVIRTSLSAEQEEKLRATFADHAKELQSSQTDTGAQPAA